MAPVYFPLQVKALRVAQEVMGKLPPNAQFAVFITEGDSVSDPGVFNLYVESDEERVQLEKLLELSEPVDSDEGFKSYERGPLLISIIDKEEGEKNGRREA